jgi:cell division septation protein DedD
MSSLECVNESDAILSEPDPSAKLRTRIYMSFAGTMALGLSLAGWYVGGRILAAEQSSSVTIPIPAVISPSQPSSPQVAAPKESSVPISIPTLVQPVQAVDVHPEAAENPVAPPAPQVFLEVAGLGAKQDALYVKKLRAKGFSARIDVGSNDVDSNEDVPRILIGPFADRQAVEKAERKLQSQGILALERTF